MRKEDKLGNLGVVEVFKRERIDIEVDEGILGGVNELKKKGKIEKEGDSEEFLRVECVERKIDKEKEEIGKIKGEEGKMR